MKTKLLFKLIGFLLLISFSSCREFREVHYSMRLQNNFQDTVYVIRAWALTLRKGGYPDTILPNKWHSAPSIRPSETREFTGASNSWDSVFKYIPSDTMSIYLFSADTLRTYTWEEIRDGYKVLRRYDLSLEDLQQLDFTIPYPPTPEMKNMHMYPPYP